MACNVGSHDETQFLLEHLTRMEDIVVKLKQELSTRSPVYVKSMQNQEGVAGHIARILQKVIQLERLFNEPRIRRPCGKPLWEMLTNIKSIRADIEESDLHNDIRRLKLEDIKERNTVSYRQAKKVGDQLRAWIDYLTPRCKQEAMTPNILVPPYRQSKPCDGPAGSFVPSSIPINFTADPNIYGQPGPKSVPNTLIPVTRHEQGKLGKAHDSWSRATAFDQGQQGFGQPGYQQFLRQNLEEGSKLILWRDTALKGSKLECGYRVTVAPGGVPSPSSDIVTVTNDDDPRSGIQQVDLASVYLVLDELEPLYLGQFQGCLVSQEYQDFLRQNLDEGVRLRLWRDCPYSGLKRDSYVTVAPSLQMTAHTLESDIVYVTLDSDPSCQVHQCSIKCLFMYTSRLSTDV